MRVFVILVVGASVASCAPPPLDIPEGCSPLGATVDCGVPYPSDLFLVDDPTMPTGKRVAPAGAAKLLTQSGLSGDVFEVWAPDGFSPVTPMVAAFGVAVDPASVPGYAADPAATLLAGAPTALIEADSGLRVAHYVDVDPRATDDARRAITLRPLARLKERTRYLVALSGLTTPDGTPVPPLEGFRRLRDGQAGGDPTLAALVPHFDAEVFPVVEKAGIARGAVQLAWDFTTGSDERTTDDMLRARAAALAALDAASPVVTVDGVFEDDEVALAVDDHPELTWRVVYGTFTAPRVVEANEPGTKLLRGADGLPAAEGTIDVPFIAVVPASVRDGAAGLPVLFGHGFFGSRDELEGFAARNIMNEVRGVGFAIDWQGMSDADIGRVVATVGGEVDKSIDFAERVPQAVVNFHALSRAIKGGAFFMHDAFTRAPARPGRDELRVPVIDVSKPLCFVGISMGHILGGTMTALNPDVRRTTMQVGGAAFSTMMFRARPFTRFLFLMDISMPDALDQQKLHAHMQSQLDRIDPATYARFLLDEELPIGPSNEPAGRRALLQMGVGDPQVPNVGTELHARTLGVPVVAGSAKDPIFGLDDAPAPHRGSGLFAFDFGVDTAFYETAEPAEDGNAVHEAVRRSPEALAQLDAFFRDGVIINPCGERCAVEVPSGTPQ
ncbi:MAG: hypothetical protein HYS27_27985 [Deltaproteobacteria bacterium]|nr:hypothetical protein [Deltaproteobacteria bacterium]